MISLYINNPFFPAFVCPKYNSEHEEYDISSIFENLA